MCDKLFAELTFGAKGLGLLGHVLLGLGVKGWILDEAVHKNPQVIAHLHRRATRDVQRNHAIN